MSEEIKDYIENTDFNKYKLVVDREYKETYIQGLEQENQQLKNDNAVMKAGLIQVSDKQRDLYKSVIDEIDDFLEKNASTYIYQDGIGDDWYYEDLDVYTELKEILEKAKGSDK